MSKKKKSFAEMKKEATTRKREVRKIVAQTPDNFQHIDKKTDFDMSLQNTHQAIQLAMQHFRSNNFLLAQNLFNKILERQPENTVIWYILGVIHFQLEQHDLAAQYINKSIELDRNQPEAYAFLAAMWHKKGNLEKVSQCYQNLMEVNLANMERERKKIDILVTGTGRSGTGYMANLLTSAGLTCGHEEIFSLAINRDNLIDDRSIGESSWLAVPFLSSSVFTDATIIHAVRHPLDTIESFMAINFFIAKNPYYFYVERFLPKIKLIDPERAPFYFFMEWTKMILKYENDKRYVRHRIEDDPISLIKHLGGKLTDLFSDTKYNSARKHTVQKKLTVKEIPHEYKTEFLDLAEQIGYKLL